MRSLVTIAGAGMVVVSLGLAAPLHAATAMRAAPGVVLRDGGTSIRGVRTRSPATVPPAPIARGGGFRTIDGSGNDRRNPSMGAADTHLARLFRPAYADGVAALAGADRPGPRAISNAVAAQTASRPNPHRLSSFFWQWGQFLDHDIDLTESAEPVELYGHPGARRRPVLRSRPGPGSDDHPAGPLGLGRGHRRRPGHSPASSSTRSPPSIDASQRLRQRRRTRAAALRTNDGSGRLHTWTTSDGRPAECPST